MTGDHVARLSPLERQFGLRVVLNSVARDKLRGLDSASLDSTVIQRRTQASRESDFLEFGLDINRDLLLLASGKPSDVALAKAMSGKDVCATPQNSGKGPASTICVLAQAPGGWFVHIVRFAFQFFHDGQFHFDPCARHAFSSAQEQPLGSHDGFPHAALRTGFTGFTSVPSLTFDGH